MHGRILRHDHLADARGLVPRRGPGRQRARTAAVAGRGTVRAGQPASCWPTSSHPHCSRLATSRASSACSARQGQAEILLADRAFLADGPQRRWSSRPRCSGIRRSSSACRCSPSSASCCWPRGTRWPGTAGRWRSGCGRLETLERIPPDNRGLARGDPGHGRPGRPRPADGQDAARRVGPAAGRARLVGPDVPLRLWPVVAALVDGPDERARAVVRGRPGCCAGRPAGRFATPTPSSPAGQGGSTQAAQAYAAGDELLAPVGWWRRFLRLFTLEAAVADGWGDPVPVLRADLGAYEQAGEIPAGPDLPRPAAPGRSRRPGGAAATRSVPPRCGRAG